MNNVEFLANLDEWTAANMHKLDRQQLYDLVSPTHPMEAVEEHHFMPAERVRIYVSDAVKRLPPDDLARYNELIASKRVAAKLSK